MSALNAGLLLLRGVEGGLFGLERGPSGIFLHGAAWCMPPPTTPRLTEGLSGGDPGSWQGWPGLPPAPATSSQGGAMLDGGRQVQRDMDVKHV